jgi:hypothetical protein
MKPQRCSIVEDKGEEHGFSKKKAGDTREEKGSRLRVIPAL